MPGGFRILCHNCNMAIQHFDSIEDLHQKILDWQITPSMPILRSSRQVRKNYRMKLRFTALSHYGDTCTCCGEDFPWFLTLDHPDGGGKEHRFKLTGATHGGGHFHLALKNAGYPPGLRILCADCNLAVAYFGNDIDALRAAIVREHILAASDPNGWSNTEPVCRT